MHLLRRSVRRLAPQPTPPHRLLSGGTTVSTSTRYFVPASHEWVTPDGFVGISNYAEQQLGDVVHVELPAIGDSFRAGSEPRALTQAQTDTLALALALARPVCLVCLLVSLAARG